MDLVDAIADPVRRQILSMLREGALTAGAVAAAFPRISRPAVSRHLRVLREHGLVVDQVTGRERLYRLDAGPLSALQQWIAELSAPVAVPASGSTGSPAERFGAALGPALDAIDTEVRRTRKERAGSPARAATSRRTA